MWPYAGPIPRDRRATWRHSRPVCHQPRLRRHGFIDDDQILDRLPQSSQLGKSRIGGIDPNKPRMRSALRAVQALAIALVGFTVAMFTDQVRSMTGQTAA